MCPKAPAQKKRNGNKTIVYCLTVWGGGGGPRLNVHQNKCLMDQLAQTTTVKRKKKYNSFSIFLI